jgi:hypothetical protein
LLLSCSQRGDEEEPEENKASTNRHDTTQSFCCFQTASAQSVVQLSFQRSPAKERRCL